MASKAADSVPNSNGTGPASFTLHVNNLPLDLEKDGVTSIFLEYGNVTGVMIIKGRKNVNQAYISYSKYEEAEAAINALHEKLPLMLSIQFKDKNLQSLQKQVEIDLSNPVIDHRYKDSFLDNAQSIKKSIELGKAKCSPLFKSNAYTPDDDLLYPVPCDTGIFNPYEPSDPFQSTNLMYTRGIAHISKDGRRHISYGRGYTYYNLPEPHYNIATYLQNVCERRENGIYEYATEELEDDSGNCKICNAPTAFRCQKCSVTFYCSRPCQLTDWPKHKLECQPLPPLIKKVVSKPTIQNGSEVETREKSPEIHKPLRRPKVLPQQQTPPHEPINQNKESPINQQQSPKSVSQEKVRTEKPRSPAESIRSNGSHHAAETIKDLSPKKPAAGNFKAVATSFPAKQQPQAPKQNKIPPKTSEDNIGFQSHIFIPKYRFVRVKIMMVQENGDCWVQKFEDLDAICDFVTEVGNHAKKAKYVDPEENVKCIVQYEDSWYRATIVELGAVSKVFLHDFGIYDEVPVRKVCPINGYESQPNYSRRIRLTDSSKIDFETLTTLEELSVKALNVESDGTIIVQAEILPGKSKEQTVAQSVEQVTSQVQSCSLSNTKSPPRQKQTVPTTEKDIALEKLEKIPNVLSTLKVGGDGFLLLHAELSKNEYNITLIPIELYTDFEKLVNDMQNDCEAEVAKNPNYSPITGELVCGKSPTGEWYRGIILTTKPTIQLIVIDESRIFPPTQCVPVPKHLDLKNICSLGLVINFLPKTKMPEPKIESASFTVIEVPGSNDSVRIKVTNDDNTFTGTGSLKQWAPRTEQKGIQLAPLISGEEVVIADCCSPSRMYVRSLNKNQMEIVHRLEQNVAKYALKPIPLTKPPVVGQMVLSHFALDDNNYRAIVTKIEGEKVIVKYVDFGNEDTTTLNKLNDLTEELKEQPACVTKVQLKGVDSNIPLTHDATEYMNELIGGEVPLTCTFEGDPIENGVVLTTRKKENVNEIFKKLLKPTWEKEKAVEDKKVYELIDLPNAKLGDVGDEIQVIALTYYPENGSLILGPNDLVEAEAIQEEMPLKIEQYVKTTTTHYIPRDNELCIAKYCGVFYRAVCLNSSASPTESRVFFLDYGNTEKVSHTDIRLISEDFIKLPAYGTLCNISAMVPDEKFNKAISDRIAELIPPSEIITVKIISVAEDDTPNIDIPAVRVKLIEEGLL